MIGLEEDKEVNMLKPLRLGQNALWKQRFRAPVIAGAQIAHGKPERGVITGTQTGQYQLYIWDIPSNSLRQITFRPDGTVFGLLSPNGRFIYYHQDEGGNEIGHFVRIPWGGGEPEDITQIYRLIPHSA